MRTILVPVDGSEYSVRALSTALSIFGQGTPLRVYVITVQMPIVSGNVTRFFSAEDIKAYYEEEGQKALAPVKHLIAQAGDMCTEEVLVGPVAETINEYSQEHGCDHIVMGTRGLGRVSGLVLGSVTTKVISLATIPVTLVK
ncbi:MAG: universal stress protein [Burkholderiaceae bacterium]|nr:MAG: universal stress protein [Burkholderiaceae bacterium]TAM09116.1 MAG: universal stress protein [Pusillimonas sp.]